MTNKFKIGDRVRVISGGFASKKALIGRIFTIDKDEGDYAGERFWSGTKEEWRWKESELELVDETEEAIKLLKEKGYTVVEPPKTVKKEGWYYAQPNIQWTRTSIDAASEYARSMGRHPAKCQLVHVTWEEEEDGETV